MMAVAERGAGVMIDGTHRTISASKPLSELNGHYNFPAKGRRREWLMPLREATNGQSPVGCAGSGYVNMVRGVFDFVVFYKLNPWDHAPGSLMVEEAGGVTRLVAGADYTVAHRSGPMVGARSEAQWQSLAGLIESAEVPTPA